MSQSNRLWQVLAGVLLVALIAHGVPDRSLTAALCANNRYQDDCITPERTASYDEIVDLPNHPKKLLVDVREPAELEASGKIPTSVNIPSSDVREALELSPEKFKEKYNRTKPGFDDPIIFSCLYGLRSADAAQEADGLGYKKVKNYVGSWKDYAKQKGLSPQE